MASSSETFLALLSRGQTSELRSLAVRVVTEALAQADQLDPRAHPIGFVHTPLCRVADQVLRLHIWPALQLTYVDPLSPVHDHVFSLRSFVVCGELRNSEVLVQPDTDGEGRHQIWHVGYGSDYNELIPTGNWVSTRTTPRDLLHAGDVYSIPAYTFHLTEPPPTLPTCTLVATQQGSHGQPRVLGGPGTSPLMVRRPRYSAKDFQRALLDVVSHLQ